MTDPTQTTRPYPHEPDRYGYGGDADDCPHCGAMSSDYCPKARCVWDADDNSGDRLDRNSGSKTLGSAAREGGTHVAPSAPVAGSGQAQTTIATGGRHVPFHVGEAAAVIGGLGETLILAAGLGAAAQSPEFAEELYAALCNTTWRHRSGDEWACTWRCAGDIAAAVRGWDGDSFMSFYCGGDEGRVSDRVRREIGKLGWKQTT